MSTPVVTAESGWDLVTAAQAGDMDAYGLLYQRYRDVVFLFLRRRIISHDLAEDLTSETFCRALRRLGSVSYQGRDVGGWFVTIAKNLMMDHMKRSSTQLETTVPGILDTDLDDMGPECELMDAELPRILTAALARLGEDQRRVLELRFYQGLPVSATATALGRADVAVKALQHRAVRSLRDILATENVLEDLRA